MPETQFDLGRVRLEDAFEECKRLDSARFRYRRGPSRSNSSMSHGWHMMRSRNVSCGTPAGSGLQRRRHRASSAIARSVDVLCWLIGKFRDRTALEAKN